MRNLYIYLFILSSIANLFYQLIDDLPLSDWRENPGSLLCPFTSHIEEQSNMNIKRALSQKGLYPGLLIN